MRRQHSAAVPPSGAATNVAPPRIGSGIQGPVAAESPKLPAFGMILVAVTGAAAAFLGSWLISLVAYLGVLLVGFVLIYLQRHLTNKAAIRSQMLQAMATPLLERVGIWCILGSCLINSWVIALHFGRYGFGS